MASGVDGDRRMSQKEALEHFAIMTTRSITESTSTMRSSSSNLEQSQRSYSSLSLSQREHEPHFGEVASMTFSDADSEFCGSIRETNRQMLHSYRLECAIDLLDDLRTRGTVHEVKHVPKGCDQQPANYVDSRQRGYWQSPRQSQSNLRSTQNKANLEAARSSLTSKSPSGGDCAEQQQKRVQEPSSEEEQRAAFTFASTSARYRQRAHDSESALLDFRAWRSQWTRDFSFTRRRGHAYIDPDPVRSMRGNNPSLPPPPASFERHSVPAH